MIALLAQGTRRTLLLLEQLRGEHRGGKDAGRKGLRAAPPEEVVDVDPTLRALVQQHLDAVDRRWRKH
jgi:hypothetical protein